MEGVKKRLEFDNKLQQIQAVHALQKMAVTRLAKLSAVGFQSTHQVAELDFLHNLCCHDNSTIATTARQCMVSLIEGQLVDLDGCVKQLLLVISSAKSLNSLLWFAITLQQLQIKEKQLQDISAGLQEAAQVHPLLKIYRAVPNDKWQLIALAFNNSLLTGYQSARPDQQEFTWKTMLQYHKIFIEAVLLDSVVNNNGLLAHILSTCMSPSYRMHLDHTTSFFIKILEQRQDIFCISNVILLESIWITCRASSHSLSETTLSDLTQYSLAVMTRPALGSNSLWNSITHNGKEQSFDCKYYGILCVILNNHMSSDGDVLGSVLVFVKRCIEQTNSPMSNLLMMPLLELLSVLNICHPMEASLIDTAKECLLHLDNKTPYLPSDAPPGGELAKSLSPESSTVYLSQLSDPDLLLSDSEVERIITDCDMSTDYLRSVLQLIECKGEASLLTVLTVGAILISTTYTRVQLLAVDAIKTLAVSQPSQASGLFLLLVHWMKRPLHPDVLFSALLSLPSFAIHKYNLPAVLKYLTGLSTSTKTRALAIRLLCDVTTLQFKAFPHLIHIIQRYKGCTTLDVMLAKAKAIHHICELRPALYTSELIPDLNDILSSHSTTPDIVLSLTIQSLGVLVEAEVLDIVSTWEVISGHLGDIDSTRVVVVSSLCEFLSLSSRLEEPLTIPYQEFKAMATARLWSYTRDASEAVASSAFKALSCFPYDTIRYSHLPEQIRLAFAPDYQENAEKYDEDMVNGAAIVQVLEGLTPGSLPGYQGFIESLVIAEVDALGVGLTRSRGTTSKMNIPKAVLRVAQVTNEAYKELKVKAGSNETLGNITVGMLFCQTTDKFTDKATMSDARQIYAASRRTLDQLTRFIREARPLSMSRDWLFSKQLLVGWTVYIKHVLETVIEGAKADRKISNRNVSATDTELIMRAKDQVENVICTSSKSDITSQCNALLALSSLLHSTRALLVEYEASEQGLPNVLLKWEENVLDNILSVATNQLDRAKLPWFTVAGHALGFNTGLMCLTLVPYSVYSANESKLWIILEALHDMLYNEAQGKCTADRFYAGLSLGTILSELLSRNHQDISADTISSTMDKCVMLLAECIYKYKLEGGILGFLQIASPLIDADSEHAQIVHDYFHRLRTSTVDSITDIEWYARALLASHLYSSHKWAAGDIVEEVELILRQPPSYGVSSGAGILVSTLSQEYHVSSAMWTDSLEGILYHWKEAASSGDENIEELMESALRGLLHLTGLLNYQSEDMELHPSALTLSERLVEALQLVNDTTHAHCYSWISGSVYMLMSGLNSHGRSNPQTYKHSLPTNSVLRYTVERLYKYVRASHSLTYEQLCTLVCCVRSGAERRQLPPLQWPSLLTTLMRLTEDSNSYEVQNACIQICVSQTHGCLLSAAFISKWCAPQFFNRLSPRAQICMLDGVDKFVDRVGRARLEQFRDGVWFKVLDLDESVDLADSLLRSLRRIVEKSADYTVSATVFVYETLIKVAHNVRPASSNYLAVVEGVGKCLLVCEDTLTRQVLTNPTDKVTQLHLACRLVGAKSSLDVLVQLVEGLALDRERRWLLKCIYPCWKALSTSQSMTFVVKIQETVNSSQDKEYVILWLEILTTAVISWADGRQHFSSLHELLPFYLLRLMSEHPWSQLKQQSLAWLDKLKSDDMTRQWMVSS